MPHFIFHVFPCTLTTALYVRASVQCNQCKLRHQKTATKPQWDVTVFNEVMIFVLPDSHVRECTIAVNVYEVHPEKKSSKHLIGQLTMGKGRQSEDEHWKLMTRSLRQPIAKWHPLYVWNLWTACFPGFSSFWGYCIFMRLTWLTSVTLYLNPVFAKQNTPKWLT